MIRTATSLNNPVIDAMALQVEHARAMYNLTGSAVHRYEVCRLERVLEDACRVLGLLE